MLHYSRWKTLAILGTVLVAIIVALPNLLPADVNQKLVPYGLRPLTLGLDLQGGSNVLLEVDRADLKQKLGKQLAGDIRSALREAKIGYQGINATADGVSVRITKPEDIEKARGELEKLNQPLDSGVFGTGQVVNLFELKLDGQVFSFSYSEQGIESKVSGAVSQVLKIVESRINALGTTEPVIQQQGKDRIVVQIPGLQDPERVKDLLGRTAKLTFQLLCEEQPSSTSKNPPGECEDLKTKDPELPPNMWVQTSSRATVDGADLVDARPGFDQSNNPVVTFRFNTKGAEKFGKLTRDNVGKLFAIILDSEIMSAPRINEPILGGSGQISGRFTTQETTDLSIVLRSGALPARLTIVEERTVGPSLGSDSIRAGLIASGIGLVLVLAFAVVAYGIFGVFANIALVVNLVMLIALMSFFGFTLTLPGIAGIVLTMGMAVDSNVLVFERIREEWRNGRTALNAIETGFRAALATILDANITTLLAAFVLFGIGSGPIRGFAVTLSIGILTTVLTAFTLTRLIVAWWVRYAKPKEVPL